MAKKAKAKPAGRRGASTRGKGVARKSTKAAIQRHRLSVIPVREALDRWLKEARGPRADGDPDISEALTKLAQARALIPNCFAKEGGPCNEVPCPPPPPPGK